MTNKLKHVAIIMDGNGRWAGRRGLPRIRGHQEGAQRVEDCMRVCREQGIGYLTLYAFSRENWQRPKEEVAFLMQLLSGYLDDKLPDLMKNNIRFNVIGRIQDMPADIQQKIARNREETRNNTGLVTTFAFSYSSRSEITEACRSLARRAASGELDPEKIDEDTVSAHLDTRDLPDPDLLIRTSGEMRVSNFLLWQISYAELYVTPLCWPDFTEEAFLEAIRDFGGRERRFGLTQASGRKSE